MGVLSVVRQPRLVAQELRGEALLLLRGQRAPQAGNGQGDLRVRHGADDESALSKARFKRVSSRPA